MFAGLELIYLLYHIQVFFKGRYSLHVSSQKTFLMWINFGRQSEDFNHNPDHVIYREPPLLQTVRSCGLCEVDSA